MKSPIKFFTAIAILLATATVAAQVYKWVDKDGKVQYTDTPPPANASKSEAKKVDTPNTGGSAPAASVAPKSTDERVKDYEKRRTEAVEKAKKDAEAQKTAEIDKENCKGARDALRDLESGRPITRVNEAGERNFMSDEQRQAEVSKAKATASASCKE